MVDDPGPYSSGATVHDWGDRVSKSITLSAPTLICLRFATEVVLGGATTIAGGGRVLLGGIPLVSSGGIVASATTPPPVTRTVYLFLPAGTHTFTFQSSLWYIVTAYAGHKVNIRSILIVAFNFPDKNGLSYDSGLISVPATSTAILINRDFTAPATRKLAVGSIKKYVAHITVYAERDAQRVSKMKNPGEADEASFFNWKILVDGVQRIWYDRRDDYETYGTTTNPTFGEGAYGRTTVLLDPSATHNLKINCYNGFTTAFSGRATVRIVICPWIIPDFEYEPITLDFPQGSTFYIITEPLDANPTKSIKIGKKRPISFGDATDYYSTASGVGILSHSYTFEIIEVANSVLVVSGFGACVSVLAADMR